ncbi:hypothetical protein [Thermoleptolyngbya sp.]
MLKALTLVAVELVPTLHAASYINSGFWIGDFGLPAPEFAGLPAIESVALFPRIDISNDFAEWMMLRGLGFGGGISILDFRFAILDFDDAP